MSHFFAYLSRMKFIKRWGLMYSTYPENIQEHSLRVAVIAHALALIRNEVFGGDVNPDRTAVLALYHDAWIGVSNGILALALPERNPQNAPWNTPAAARWPSSSPRATMG
jgi:5'-deoxynucleotidase